MPDLEKVIRELETLGAWHTHHYAPFHYEAAETIHDAIVLLREQKPAKNAGKWIKLTGMAPPEYHGHKICSVCESFAPYDPLHPGREQLSPYCPGCGAKMEVDKDA